MRHDDAIIGGVEQPPPPARPYGQVPRNAEQVGSLWRVKLIGLVCGKLGVQLGRELVRVAHLGAGSILSDGSRTFL